jgi:hypothetical protein
MDIFIFGYYGRGNLGDDFFIPSFTVLFAKIFGESPKTIENQECRRVEFNSFTLHFLHPEEILPKSITPNLIIVGGGDVLNEYFMKPLTENIFPKFRCKKYAVGVGGDPKYFSVFDGVWSRNSIVGALFCPDLVFLPSIWRATPPKLSRRTSSIKFTSPSRRELNDSIQNLHHLVQTTERGGLLISLIPKFTPKFLISLSTLIARLAPSFNFITFIVFSEEQNGNNDMCAIEKVRSQLCRQRSSLNIRLMRYGVDFNTYSEAIRLFKDHSAAICMRFHSHILSVIAEVPFISLATTRKCSLFMSENRLPHFKIGALPDGTPDSFSYQSAEIMLRSGMNSNIYKSVRKNITSLWRSSLPTIYFETSAIPDATPTVPLTVFAVKSAVTDFLVHNYKTDQFTKENISEAVRFALFLITKKTESSYFYGFLENTIRDSSTFDSSLQYLIEKERRGINISYIDQTDCWGKHRYGWEWICNNIKTNLAGTDGVRCDLFVDRTFLWMEKTLKFAGIIPYTVPWIGFVHHPPCIDTSVPNSLSNMIKNSSFIESLTTCQQLITFSKYVGDYISHETGFQKITVLKHPAPTSSIKFCADKYFNIRSVAQIGSWLRDELAICDLAAKTVGEIVPHKFYSIGGSQIKSITTKLDVEFCGSCSSVAIMEEMISQHLMEKIKSVICLEKLDDVTYDGIFADHIVFLKMIDCSAVNTILECIIHETPLLINKHPAIVEYLGEEYPFYYSDIDDAAKKLRDDCLIVSTHNYLKALDKSDLSMDLFIGKMKQIASI